MTTATRFTRHQDVAAVECNPATGKPPEGAWWWPGTVTEVHPWSVTARADGETRLFLLDSCGRAWAEGGHLRLVPLCRCESPILGESVKDPDDPRGEEFCGDDCLTTAAERSHGAFAARER